MLLRAAVACLTLIGASCGVPRDPEGTLEQVRSDVIRVGATENEPWVTITSGEEPDGVEVELVRRFASDLDARIEWFFGSEEELAGAIEMREIDLMIGGLTSQNPFQKQVSFTHPYITTQTVIAVPAGDEVPTDIAGLEVAVEDGTEAAGILAKTDAIPMRVDDPTLSPGLKVVEDWMLEPLRLQDTGVRLEESDHVMGVPHGENAWLTTLERFLLRHEATARELLEASVP